ncbi:thioredoxin family protein [Enterococcus hirae]|uniref:thioredoxin family protein n=1 Tax=Enterococcus hirae TaxID=1354 RepID=UPI003075C7E0
MVSTIQTNRAIQQQELDRSVVTIATNEKRALVFYKDDCSACKAVFPELYKENLVNDNLLFINLNQPQNKGYIAKYQLKTVPTIVTPKGRYVGTDTKKIQQLLEE